MIMRGKESFIARQLIERFRFNEAAHDHARKGFTIESWKPTSNCFNEAAHDHARKGPFEARSEWRL